MSRDFLPVEENVEAPSRLSVTLLKHANACPRSAYLYLKHKGGPASHAMMRGSLAHLFAEKLVMELMVRGERSLSEDTQGVASLTGAMMDAIVAEHPELPVTTADMEILRIVAFHIATGLDVDPQTVVAVERMFQIEAGGWRVVGKMDLAAFPDPVTGTVDDWKVALGIPTEEVFSQSFQTGAYSLMLVEGNPVEQVDGEDVLSDPIGKHLHHVRAREVFPRAALRPDGTLVTRTRWRTRFEVTEFRGDLERIVARVEHGLQTGDWPAVSGSHCSMCPMESACPIPREARRFAGAIETVEQAGEALEWASRTAARVKATREEVRNFARANDTPIVAGADIYDFEVSHGREIVKRGRSAAWDELQGAVEAAAQYGSPFDVNEWIRFRTNTTFKKVGVIGDNDGDGTDGEDGGSGDGGGSLDERFGADAPF